MFCKHVFYRRIRNFNGERFPCLVGIKSFPSHSPHPLNDLICKLGAVSPFPASRPKTTIPVIHILLVRTAIKMTRTATEAIVALVENKLSAWDSSILENPRKAMRSIAIKINGVLSIPSNNRSGPNPAGVRFSYLRPEAVDIFMGNLLVHDVVLSIS